MPNLEVIIVRAVMGLLPQLIDAIKRGDTTPALEARAKRLAIDAAYEEMRKLRVRS